MAFETGLEGKPWYVSAAVAVGIAVIIAFGWHAFKVKDIKKSTERQERRLARLEKKLDEARSAEKSLPQFREEVRRLELELEKLLRVLPSRRNTEDLLRRIRTLTEQGNFRLLRFTPRGQRRRDFFYEWPIQVRLIGSYHNLALFFDRVSRFARIINVDSLAIRSRRTSGSQTISASFTMKTYLSVEPKKGDSA